MELNEHYVYIIELQGEPIYQFLHQERDICIQNFLDSKNPHYPAREWQVEWAKYRAQGYRVVEYKLIRKQKEKDYGRAESVRNQTDRT